MEWINVNDKLPTVECLAIGHQEEIIIGYISFDGEYESYTCENEGCILTDVTHWMPLPEPPEPPK